MPRHLIACLLAFTAAACSTSIATDPSGRLWPPVAGDPLVRLGWLSGSWINDDGDNRSEEHWTVSGGRTMIGMNRTIRGDRTVFFEYLRIEARDDGIFYLASPKGRQPPTPFKLIDSAAQRVVFENPQHDFPQRIIYERHGDELAAAIEGVEKGKPRREQWTWRRAG